MSSNAPVVPLGITNRKTVVVAGSLENGLITREKEPFETAVPVNRLSLDGGDDADGGDTEADTVEDEATPLTEEERYEVERHNVRVKKWRSSPFAIGLTEPTWMAERYRPDPNSGAYGDDQVEPDHTGCLCFSARICPLLGAQRVGNMVVLKSSHEWVEEITEDEETGERTTHRYTRPVLNIVVGPYWPMMAFVTYPLILGISGWTFVTGILPGGKPFPIVLGWAICTVGLIVALAFTACSDPGIMHRYREAPPQYEGIWRWSDQALTYRPKGAYYDSDTAVVVEDFDHTCPWTGTAIGRGNIIAFQTFVCLIFVCMIMDIFLITGAI